MKKILVLAYLTLGIAFTNNVQASVPVGFKCNMSSCSSTVTLDSGVGKSCNRTSDSCQCSKYASDCCPARWEAQCSDAGAGWSSVGAMVGGGYCCKYTLSGQSCPMCAKNTEPTDASDETTVTSLDDDQNLDEVFESGMDDSRAAYFGFKDDIIRSSNLGRTTSAAARLDACLFYTDVDAITGADNSEKWTNCYGSQGCGITSKNEYCRATGMNNGTSMVDAVCKDRCDCVYGFGTCENL